MALDVTIPCPAVPKIPSIPNVNILGMAELKGFLDFSVGSPRDCTLAINLMAQLAPLLASMTCLLRILAVINALKAAVESGFTKTGELLEKIGDMATCFGAFLPPTIGITIKGILELIISFLSCFTEQLDHLVSFQASIDLNAAEGNPTLRASLECAKENAQNSMDNLLLSLEAIQPLMEMVTSLASVGTIDLKLPSVASLSAETDHVKVIQSLKQAVATMKESINSLPG